MTKMFVARLPGAPLRQCILPALPRERPDRPLAQVGRLSGWLALRDDRVWLESRCPENGLVRTLCDESAEILSYLNSGPRPSCTSQT
jgi:hypothetical protein